MTESRVAVVGDALIDEIVDPGVGTSEVVGGAGLNVAVGLAVLGVPVCLVAMLGSDEGGAAISRHLQQHGVTLIATPSPLGTSRAVAHRVGGEATYTFNQAARARHLAVDLRVRAALAAASHVVVSSFPLDDPAQVDEVFGAVADARRRLIVDPNPRPGMMRDLAAFRAGVDRVAAECRLIKIGDEDAALLYDESVDASAERLLQRGAGAVLTTSGADGAGIRTADGIRVTAPIAQLPGPIVDTIGAGDATLASMTAAIVDADRLGRPVDWAAALDEAMTVAAATCRSAGGLLRRPGR